MINNTAKRRIDMRKFRSIIVLFFIAGMILSGPRKTMADSAPRIILYTFYTQLGWDDFVEIGSLDEKGMIRTLSGNPSDLGWPSEPEARQEYLRHTEKFSVEGTVKFNKLFSIKSLINCVENQERNPVYAADDAGTEESYAVRYSKDGEPTFILLGISGETKFENTDTNAQALYLLLRQLFPGITDFAYDEDRMGPAGFIPVSIADFTGLDPNTVMNAEIVSVYADCEEGNIPREMAEEEKTNLISLIRNGKVTGKADCLMPTGGFSIYYFYDPDGNSIGTIGFEDGLLIADDGRYYFESL